MGAGDGGELEDAGDEAGDELLEAEDVDCCV